MDTVIDLLFIIVPIIAGFLACISLYRYWKKISKATKTTIKLLGINDSEEFFYILI
ncbi:TPA: hypothetical protein ACGM09_001276 [Streptococcus agalactiae]